MRNLVCSSECSKHTMDELSNEWSITFVSGMFIKKCLKLIKLRYFLYINNLHKQFHLCSVRNLYKRLHICIDINFRAEIITFTSRDHFAKLVPTMKPMKPKLY